MKKQTIARYEFSYPVMASVLYFLLEKHVLAEYWYLLFVSLMSIYFFPVKLLLNGNLSGIFHKNRMMELFSSLVFFIIGASSVIMVVVKNHHGLTITFEVFSIVNILLGLYYSTAGKQKDLFPTHFGFIVLTAAILGI